MLDVLYAPEIDAVGVSEQVLEISVLCGDLCCGSLLIVTSTAYFIRLESPAV